ncbi:xylulokinase [Rufibacter glacialis]|uniref:Carbohydrate kinase n=1 Tax=Rufibacter glacialis TaxID=1259555 RepID=A0A5M8QBL8_9BACT|nr:FGGY family carbohydrate kinase [Rufibacter glacialis]KAA6432493.1 carbohydrate kinase [Rufibacter glacialis]GGK79157.1 carbohydrate kinase [Rufibacter glacialis]
MLLLGIDVGTSSIKVSVVDAATQKALTSAQFPETESKINSRQPGWAEQAPEMWWEHAQKAILKANATGAYDPQDIGAIGIAYQMHGLVIVDQHQEVLRESIIWCDSRAVPYGQQALEHIGQEQSLTRLLNSPGNFTAAKLAWVKENEPETFNRIHKIMLPGDYLAMKLTGEITTSVSALSEGIFWDFQQDEVSKDVMGFFGFSQEIIPQVRPLFSSHGEVKPEVAAALSLKAGIPVTYKAGDQPNNALSLNVLNPGEVAATAGTSGVIYGVSDQLVSDPQSRVNTFAHVNYSPASKRVGVLMNINGTGIMNSWVKENLGHGLSYPQMNDEALNTPIGSQGLRLFPFGNGAERVFNNRILGAQFHRLDLNLHSKAHVFRAVQEGIAFTFRYGLDIMRENGMNPQVIRAGQANLFLSPLFAEAFVNATHVPVELYQNDGSVGAALGAGIGAQTFASAQEAFSRFERLKVIEPTQSPAYEEAFQDWKALLEKQLNN